MIGTHVDQKVFSYLVGKMLPDVTLKLAKEGVHLHLITLEWFLCLYVNTLPMETVLRVWDVFFLEGIKGIQETSLVSLTFIILISAPLVIFRVGVAIIKLHESLILEATDSAEVYNNTREMGQDVHDADNLLKVHPKSTTPNNR